MRRLLKNIFLLCLLAGLSLPGLAQRYTLRNYSVKDGLPQSQVTNILEDENGYFWIGTVGGGLARFDGSEFKVYTTFDGLCSNMIEYLMFDRHKHICIAHSGGITLFDGASFKAFPLPGNFSKDDRITSMISILDTIYVSSPSDCLAKIYDDSVHYLPKPQPRIYQASFRVNGDAYLTCLSDTTFLIQSHNGALAISANGRFDYVYRAFRHHGIWLQTNGGFFRYNPVKHDFDEEPLELTGQVLYYDSTANVYWTRLKKNLLREWSDGGKLHVDTVLVDADIMGVLVDSEGLTWIATSGMGIFKYFVQDFDQVNSGNFNCIFAIEMDNDHNLWLGSSTRGLRRVDKDGTHMYIDKTEASRNFVHCIKKAPDGTIWVGTVYGLGKYNKAKDKIEWLKDKQDQFRGWVYTIEFDKNGHTWIGTPYGLEYYDGTTFKLYTTKDGLASNGVLCLYYNATNETLYAGTNEGVNIIRNGKITSLDIPAFHDTGILSINPYLGQYLLIGSTGAGVVVNNPSTGLTKPLTSRDGLASDFIYFVKADEKGYLWIGTEKGINKLLLDKNLNITENQHFNHDNGLLGVETNHNAIYLSPNEKYFGLIDGLYTYNDQKQKPGKTFSVHLTDVQILFGEYSPRQYADSLTGFYRIPYHPSFPADKNHITFKFNRVDKRFPKSVKFKYYLENFDKTWSQPSTLTQVTYGNLPPGEYKFRVVASDKMGNWVNEQLIYPFTIEAPFYQTSAFFFGLGILIIGIVVFVLYLRVKARVDKTMLLERMRITEQETLRKEIARDFHDEMGNQLTRIINYVSLLKMNGHTNGSSALYAKVEDSAKYLYTGTRDFIWAIDPLNDELSKLFIHIRDFGEKLFSEKDIHFRAFNEIKDAVPLPYGFSREANLIFKEAMTNAFRHSGAMNVGLSLITCSTYYSLSLTDDGTGFENERNEKTNGLDNIRHRAKKIGCDLSIVSGNETGTTIVLNIPVIKSIKHGITI